MSEKIYVGNGKKIVTQYGDMMKLSITSEDLEKMQKNMSDGWINLNVKERREPSAGGMTHYLEVDTWKPSGGSAESGDSQPGFESGGAASEDPEDLPF